MYENNAHTGKVGTRAVDDTSPSGLVTPRSCWNVEEESVNTLCVIRSRVGWFLLWFQILRQCSHMMWCALRKSICLHDRLLISKLVHCYCQSVKGRKAKLAVCPPQWPLSLQEDRAGRENP